MSAVTLSVLLAVAAFSGVSAQDSSAAPSAAPAATTTHDWDLPGFTALADKRIPYNQIPYQVDTFHGTRGVQFGYNLCNSTTENQDSLCQTAYLNHIDDWCLWAPSKGPTTIAETEGEEVAWCTKPGRGTRLIPKNAITGVQFLRAKSYLQVIAFFDQTQVNIKADDYGGELDPHGADLRGNPLGGLVYSNNLPMTGTGDNSSFTQVIEWHNFIGANSSCFKVCDPQDPHAKDYCQHIYDRIGVSYTCPNGAKNGVFEVCDSDNQDFPGVYVGADGVTSTYTQPAESLGAITSMPYTARIPASSNCVTFQSTDLFTALPTGTIAPASSAASATATPSGSKGASGSGTATRTGSAASSTGTGSTTPNGAGVVRSSVFTTIAGVIFAVAFFA